MFAWLNGPGKSLRDPLKGSTNYLSAYDRSGNLIRGKTPRTRNPRRERDNIDEADLEKDEAEVQARELEEGVSEEEVRKRARVREARRHEREDTEERGGIPPERQSDMRPYPHNSQFQSQAVLSEDLREKLYQLVAVDGLDLKSVSATFGVDIRRVAAVVRLKTIEKKWIDEVSTWILLIVGRLLLVMIVLQNSISLEDYSMVTQHTLRTSLKHIFVYTGCFYKYDPA